MSNSTLTNTLDPLQELMVWYCSNRAAGLDERPHGEGDCILKKFIEFHSSVLTSNKTCSCFVSSDQVL